jgi:hypothetical protein
MLHCNEDIELSNHKLYTPHKANIHVYFEKASPARQVPISLLSSAEVTD